MTALWDGGRGLIVLAVICLLGLYWRLRTGLRYGRIARQCENLDKTKDRHLQAIKSQFEELSHLRKGLGNLPVFLQRSLRRYRVRGLPLMTWNRLASLAAGADILGGLLLAAVAFIRGQDIRTVVFYGAAGVVLGGMGVLFGILVDNGGREEQTVICLQDAFENRIFPQLAEEGLSEKDGFASRGLRESREEEAPPVYTIKPEEEEVIEEIFREYFS